MMAAPVHDLAETLEVAAAAAARAVRPGVYYDRVAILFHWAIAGLILLNLPLGLTAHFVEERAVDQAVTDLHKSIGLLVLVLALLRLAWRIGHKPPAFPDHMTSFERAAARTVHWLLYGLTIAVPIAGWWMTSAFGRHPPSFFGLFDFPFLPVQRGMEHAFRAHDLHQCLAIALAGLAVAHIAAAFRHQYVARDQILSRMSPFAAGAPHPGNEELK